MDEKLQTLRKYNLWDSAPFDFGYGRSGYTDKIAAYTGNRSWDSGVQARVTYCAKWCGDSWRTA